MFLCDGGGRGFGDEKKIFREREREFRMKKRDVWRDEEEWEKFS